MSQQTSLPNQPNPVAASTAAAALNVPPAGLAQAAEQDAIRPFRVDIPESEVAELKRRIKETRWPEKETVADESQGVRLKTIQELARYWADEYDWRKIESRLNSYPNFITEIDGLDFHFIHVRSKHENAMPLLIAHGWPGSIVEQVKLIEPLTDPTAHSGSAADAFHVVIPSMPGYGFSGKPSTTGWNPQRIARAYAELMSRLGYERYAAQGGDWGSIVVNYMGTQEPEGLLGIHTNMPEVIPPDIDALIWSGSPLPDNLSAEERKACEQVRENRFGYAIVMGTRPQTLTGLVDSPVGLAAFMIDHDWKSHAMIARSFAGVKEGLSPDDVLDNVSLFWFTRTAISAARLYWEQTVAGNSFFATKGVKLPVACSVFPDEMYVAPRSWAEKAYPNLIHFNKLPKGGHFAAWEQPEFMISEIRTGLGPLRKSL
ncbi:epoxide hydrolase family protein [Microvirga sp. VF16]|uniref:epoxide hydrolase family protein n=1 Tax=Microvirga sp. VF16 TaxID=2807101 RepID=UPI00193D2A42|nr:epoxide hydrolase [Microvirga sp. VF16]QRM33585.1 alpha/beta fold hydrolase [Microvirga sp. VF16]